MIAAGVDKNIIVGGVRALRPRNVAGAGVCARGRLDRRFNDWNTSGEEPRARSGSPNNLICIKHSYRP